MPIDSNIRNIIKAKGCIKIDDMMREVLSNTPNSYYKITKNIGKYGDFITSPEISQLFGELIALWAIEKWQELGAPKKLLLIELGPGQGQLMQDFLRVAKLIPEFFNATQIYLLEINQHFIKKQKSNLAEYDKNIKWISDIKQIPKLPSIIISNEFFDALPIKQYMKVKDKWFESILVIDPIDERIKYDKIELHIALQRQLALDHINAQDGAIIEESIESLDIVRFLSKHINNYRGAKLIIDYGYALEAPTRTRGQYNSTLQAIKEHQYHSIIDSLGEADLTAHVDFDALKKAAHEQGVNNYSISSQKEFLTKYGIEIRLQALKISASQEEKSILDKQVFRLTSSQQMGELFKVLELIAMPMKKMPRLSKSK
tara:strand:- start:766 stop:1881 length:1116 start_codon:yes stop_codon:yes gene_type:complete